MMMNYTPLLVDIELESCVDDGEDDENINNEREKKGSRRFNTTNKSVSFMEDIELSSHHASVHDDDDDYNEVWNGNGKGKDSQESVSLEEEEEEEEENAGGDSVSSGSAVIYEADTTTMTTPAPTVSCLQRHYYQVLKRRSSSMEPMGHTHRQWHHIFKALYSPMVALLHPHHGDEDDPEHEENHHHGDQEDLEHEDHHHRRKFRLGGGSLRSLVRHASERSSFHSTITTASARTALMGSTRLASTHHLNGTTKRTGPCSRNVAENSTNTKENEEEEQVAPPRQYTLLSKRGRQENMQYLHKVEQYLGIRLEWDEMSETTRCTCCSGAMSFEQIVVNYLHWCFRSSFMAFLLSSFGGFLILTLLFAAAIWILGRKYPKCIGGVDFETDCFTDAFALSWTTFSTVRRPSSLSSSSSLCVCEREREEKYSNNSVT